MKKGIYDFMYFFPFLKEIIKRDFKKKYYKSVLGVAWSMLSPLLLMIVITIVFSTIFRRTIEHYPAYWFSGNLIFTFVFDASTLAMGSILGNASLIKKMRIPNYFFVVSTVTQSFINMLFSIIPFFLVSLIIGVEFTPYMLLIPVPLLMSYIFGTSALRLRYLPQRPQLPLSCFEKGVLVPDAYFLSYRDHSRSVQVHMGYKPHLCLYSDIP